MSVYYRIENNAIIGYVRGGDHDPEDPTSTSKRSEQWVSESPGTRQIIVKDSPVRIQGHRYKHEYLRVENDDLVPLSDDEIRNLEEQRDINKQAQRGARRQRKRAVLAKLGLNKNDIKSLVELIADVSDE